MGEILTWFSLRLTPGTPGEGAAWQVTAPRRVNVLIKA